MSIAKGKYLMNPSDNSQTDRDRRRVNPENLAEWKVLIVDDQKDNLAVAEMVFHFHKAEVRVAHNGVEGMAMLKDYSPTLILLDLSMPEMSGWEMFKELRANESTMHVPVIALTAHAMAGDEQRVKEAGFDGYIAKPFSVATIIFQIQNILKSL
jgi:two-component system, cell cycle response regulator DivK